MKKILLCIGIIVLLVSVYQIKSFMNITEDNKENVNSSVIESIKEYVYVNKTLSPVEVEFKAEIDMKQNVEGQYYINTAKYQNPIVINIKEDSFQIDSTSAKLIDSNRTYMIEASGSFVKDGNNMGIKTVSAYFHINAVNGKITASYM